MFYKNVDILATFSWNSPILWAGWDGFYSNGDSLLSLQVTLWFLHKPLIYDLMYFVEYLFMGRGSKY